MNNRAKKLWGESSSELSDLSDSENSLQPPPNHFSDDDSSSLSLSDPDSMSSVEIPQKKVVNTANSRVSAATNRQPASAVSAASRPVSSGVLDQDVQLQELLRDINADFFQSSGFNPMKYYQTQGELREQTDLINEAVGRLVSRSYVGFTQATSSFRDVLHTFTTAQMGLRALKDNFAESKAILGTSTDNIHSLHLKYAVLESVVRIFQKAEVVNDAHALIKTALHHHQYLRAALVLSNAISVLSSQDLSDIASLITVRESLIALGHELERKLGDALQSLVFLRDPRLRQSVLDGAGVKALSFLGSASEARNPYGPGTGYCPLHPSAPPTQSSRARSTVEDAKTRLNALPTEVFVVPSPETILSSLPFSPALVRLKDASSADVIGSGKLFDKFSQDALSGAHEIAASESGEVELGKTHEKSTTRRFHKLYHYKLMHIENTPSYIADPLAHPHEHAIILVEALHVLRALPGAQSRLLKSFEKSLAELTEREVKCAALTHKKLKLTNVDVGAEEDTHNTAVASGDALIGLLPMRISSTEEGFVAAGSSEVDFAHEVLSIVLVLHTHVLHTAKGVLGHMAWVLGGGMLPDAPPPEFYVRTLEAWDTKQSAVELHRQLIPLALASQTAVQKLFFTLLNRQQVAPLLAATEVRAPQPVVKPAGKRDVALQAPKITFGLSQGSLASFSWDRLITDLASGQKQAKPVLQNPASNLAVPPKHSAALAMRCCETQLCFSATVTLLVDGHFAARYLPLPPFLPMFFDTRKEKKASVVPLAHQMRVLDPHSLAFFQADVSAQSACHPLVSALKTTQEGFIHPRTSQIFMNASAALASMHDCLGVLETNVPFSVVPAAPQSSLLGLVQKLYHAHHQRLRVRLSPPHLFRVIAQSGMLCRYAVPIATALKSAAEDARYVSSTTAHLTAESLTQLADLAVNTTRDATQKFLSDRAAFLTLQASSEVAREMSEDPWYISLRLATQAVTESCTVTNFSSIDNPIVQALVKRANGSMLSDRTDGTGVVTVALVAATLAWLANFFYLLPLPQSNSATYHPALQLASDIGIPCLGGFSDNGQYVANTSLLTVSSEDRDNATTPDPHQDDALRLCIGTNLEACIAFARLAGTFQLTRAYAAEETAARRAIAVDNSAGATEIRGHLALDADVRKERAYNWLAVANSSDTLLSDVRWLLASELLKAADMYLHTVKLDLLMRISKALSSLRQSVTLDTTISVDTYAPVSVNSKAMQWAFLCAEYIHSVVTAVSTVWSPAQTRYLLGGVADVIDTLIRYYCGLCVEQAGDQLPQILRKGVGVIQQTVTSLWPVCEHLDILGEHQAFQYESFSHVEAQFEKTLAFAHLLTLSYEDIVTFQLKNPKYFDTDSYASAIKYAKRA